MTLSFTEQRQRTLSMYTVTSELPSSKAHTMTKNAFQCLVVKQ